MQETTTKPQFAVGFDTVSAWLTSLGDDYQTYRHAGWQFVTTLEAGVSQFEKRRDVSELYDLAMDATGLSRKRIANLVSMARKPSSRYAAEHGLEIAHAEAVLGLDDSEAIALLQQAVEQAMSAGAVNAVIRERRQAATAAPGAVIPDAGNVATDEDPPFANRNSVLYQDDEYNELADSFAGDVCAYDGDDDGFTYTIDEIHGLVQRAIDRLRDVDHGYQYTMESWLKQIAAQAY